MRGTHTPFLVSAQPHFQSQNVPDRPWPYEEEGLEKTHCPQQGSSSVHLTGRHELLTRQGGARVRLHYCTVI